MSETRWYQYKPQKSKRLQKQWWLLLTVAFFLIYLVISAMAINFQVTSKRQLEMDRTKQVANLNDLMLNQLNEITAQNIPDDFKLINENSYSGTIYPSISYQDIETQVFDRSKQVVFETLTKPVEMNFSGVAEAVDTEFGNRQIYVIRGPIFQKDSNQLLGYYQVANFMSGFLKWQRKALLTYFLTMPFVLLFFIMLGYGLSKLLFEPVERISKVITAVDEENVQNTLIKEPDKENEFSDIIYHLNHLLQRIAFYIDQQKHFVEDVSHELRTPVAIVEGHLKLLNRWGKDEPEVLDESLKLSLAEIQRMKSLIQEMLDLQRADMAVDQYRDKTTLVYEKTKRIYENFKMLYPDFDIFLDSDLVSEIEAKIYENHYEQILIIFLDNAVKYSRDRKEIHVSLASDNGSVNIAIQDFGEGMSEEDRVKVFSRFYRVDKARARDKGGNGLGLSIAKQLVESYGGTISVESVLDHGSIFRVSLPIMKKIPFESSV